MNDNDYKKNRIFALIGAIGVVVAVIFMIVSTQTGINVLGLIGMILFVLTVLGLIIAGSISDKLAKAKNAGKPSAEPAMITLNYRLLTDERTKQDPDVQRLLQYPTVQKAFFDPNYITSAEAQNDPYIRELMQVFERMSEGGAINGDLSPFTNAGAFPDPNSAYFTELTKRENERRERARKRPSRIVSRILKYVGLALFLVPFAMAFFSGTSHISESAVPLLLGCAFGGALLCVVSNIVRKI